MSTYIALFVRAVYEALKWSKELWTITPAVL